MNRRILIVDDELKMRRVLQIALEEEGYSPTVARDAGEALKKLSENSFALMIADIRMPGMDGLELLKKIKASGIDVSSIIMTAYGTVPSAVEAMKLGAFDYVQKPFDIEEMKIIVSRALETKQLIKEKTFRQKELREKYDSGNIIGESESVKSMCELAKDLSGVSSTILICGESGTGKELVARAVHFSGGRAERPFVAVNCAAIPETLLESELFGHVKGAFTGAYADHTGKFELADGGSLFLDEVSAMSPAMQANLLRVLETRSFEKVGGSATINVDVRIIAATNTDLRKMIKSSEFREDLYYRLNVVSIEIPPLRERKEDIPLLISHFLDKYNRELGRNVKSVSGDSMGLLMGYHWPGNVRELENVIERAVVLNRGSRVLPEHLPVDIRKSIYDNKKRGFLCYGEAKEGVLREFEVGYFSGILERTGGNVSEAARIAGIDRKNFYEKLRKLGIEPGRRQ